MVRLNKTRSIGKRSYYNFQCTCGNIIERRSDSPLRHCLLDGCTVSNVRRHGESHTRLYKIWDGIKGRALHGNHASAKTYLERGITICEAWLEFSTFKQWAMSAGYSDDLTIDRLNINKGYSPENCEWVTRSENTKRQIKDGHTNNKHVLLNGVFYQSIAEAARIVAEFTATKPKSIQTALQQRILTNSYKPYKGFVIEVAKEVINL